MAIKRISANLLGGNAVTAAKIAGGAISAADIADNSITAAKISASTSPTFGGLSVSTAANQVSTFTSTDANARIAVTDSTDTGYFIVNSGILSIGQSLTTSNDLNIDSSGNVGIGTNNPSFALDISGANNSQLRVLGTDTNPTTIVMDYNSTGSTDRIRIQNDAGDMKFTTNNGQVRQTLLATGNVGIGTDSPGYLLHLQSTTGSILNIDARDTTTGAAGTGAGILFTGHDGVIARDQARIASAKTNATSGNYSADLVFSTRYNGYGVGEKMRLYDEGNLEIKNIADNGLTLNKQVASTWNYIEYKNQGTRSHYLGTDSAGKLVLGSDSGAIFYFTGADVGVGTDDPASLLHLQGSASVVSATQLTLEGRYSAYGAGINFVSRTTNDGTRVSMAKITADGENSWNTTASTQDAGLRFYTTADGTSTERMRIDSYGAIQIGGSSNAGFIDFDGTNLQLNTQRNPNTGVFTNTSRAHAGITLRGDDGSSLIRFFTASGNNTTATRRMQIDHNGNVSIGDVNAGSGKLTIDSDDTTETGAGGILLQTASSSMRIGGTSGRSWIQSHSSQPLWINKLGNNIVLNGDGAGNVVIGSGSATDKLNVYGTTLLSGNTYIGGSSDLLIPTGGNIKTYSGATTYTAMSHTLSTDGNFNMLRFGSAGYPAHVTSSDFRSPSPDDFQSRGISFHFTSYALNNTANWADMMVMNTYSDSSGGEVNAFLINKSTNGAKIARQGYNSASNFSAGSIYTLDYTSASDARVKENIQNITNGLELISQLRPVTYEWTDEYILAGASKNANENIWNEETESLTIPETKTTNVGLIAQEVEEIIPTVVHQDRTTIPGVEGTLKNIDYEKLVPHLISAIKELKERIEVLEG